MLVWLGLFGLVASFHGIIIGYSRQIFALSRAGYLPPVLGRVHPTLAHAAHRDPGRRRGRHRGDLQRRADLSSAVSRCTANIVTMSVFGAIVMYILSMASLFKLRAQRAAAGAAVRRADLPAVPGVRAGGRR